VTRIIESLGLISKRYDALYVDLWGCLHNGYAPFGPAVIALQKFRQTGGLVLLLTNSPRPRPSVIRQLDKIGVPRDCYDEIAASGDAAQYALASGAIGTKVYHLGPKRDLGFFEDLPADVLQGKTITLVPLAKADGIACTGLFNDDTETPGDYRATFLQAKARGLQLLCANPDVMVDKGDHRIYCAGALAQAYAEMGGTSHYFGKPHPAIYDLAQRRLLALGRDIDKTRILAIGDGINTDIKGAMGEDIDSLFISGGLAAKETGTDIQPDATKLKVFLENAQVRPQYTMGHLR